MAGLDEWAWDESLFRGAAVYYEQGRLPYPPRMADVFASHADLSGAPRLIDVGCGPGSVARRLAHLFASVVGVDADHDMLVEAARLAADARLNNVSWLRARAEALPPDLGPFRYATFAQSFHWMDRELVASKTFDMLESGGAFVHVDTGRWGPRAAIEARHPPPPDDAIRDLLASYLGPHRRAGQGVRLTSPSGEAEILRAAGFRDPVSAPVPPAGVIERSIDDVVASVFSASNSAPHLFGDRLARFERDLRRLLEQMTTTGMYAVVAGEVVLRFYRRP